MCNHLLFHAGNDIAIVDECDDWCLDQRAHLHNGHPYAYRDSDRTDVRLYSGKQRVRISNEVVGDAMPWEYGVIRYKNGNRLDCRRKNLYRKVNDIPAKSQLAKDIKVLGGGIVQVGIKRGGAFWVDIDDAERVLEKSWHFLGGKGGGFYVRTAVDYDEGLLLHRFIMNCHGGMVVDHINGVPMDNRKENLRIVTHSENLKNRTKTPDHPLWHEIHKGKCSTGYLKYTGLQNVAKV